MASAPGEWSRPAVIELLSRIAAVNGGNHAGVWDVVAWSGQRTVFVESKRANKDAIRPTQTRWLAAALKAGLGADDFLVAEWHFD
jgi:hypothetical protein